MSEHLASIKGSDCSHLYNRLLDRCFLKHTALPFLGRKQLQNATVPSQSPSLKRGFCVFPFTSIKELACKLNTGFTFLRGHFLKRIRN